MYKLNELRLKKKFIKREKCTFKAYLILILALIYVR
jgi:hypothetical protein